ncbi:MAG: ABC transporter permease [Saprospiraceae bacterium]|nr:ABC transporter permease [Saprospiraceae bacterium]
MNKLWLIIQREYLVRVRKKTFILTTILMPLLVVALYALPVLFVKMSEDQKKIVYTDDSGYFESIPSSNSVHFKRDNRGKDALRKVYKNEGYDGVLYIPNFKSLNNDLKVEYFSDQQISVTRRESIERRLEKRIRNKKMEDAGLTQAQLDQLETSISLAEVKETMNDSGELEQKSGKGNAGLATGMGMMMGMFMYIILLIYGSMVMRSVQEEKINRIVEVIISSVKPFQLMLGKVIGVGGVGLTQILIWIILLVVFQAFALPLLGFGAAGAMPDPSAMGGVEGMDIDEVQGEAQKIMEAIFSLNWGFIIPVLIIFFLGGFFIYSSLFAAVGSAVGDDLGESQTLMFPIMLPIIISIFITMSIMNNPNSGIAVFGSIFPLFSPVVMPARLAFDPPLWEVLLSITLLLASVVFFIWLSGRIYRVGIFMYGKKITFKEIWKWLFYKG